MKKLFLLVGFSGLLLTSCGGEAKKTENETSTNTEVSGSETHADSTHTEHHEEDEKDDD